MIKWTKRAVVLIAGVLALLTLAACAQGPAAPTGTAAEIVAKIFETSGVDPFGPQQPLVTDDEKTFFLWTSDYPAFEDAVAMMPMINIDTRVMVVIKAADEGEVETIKARLEENIDPTRLVCVTFSPEDVAIESRGDVIGWMDADMSMNPAYLRDMIPLLDEHDVVIGSRYVEGGADIRPQFRVVTSFLVNRFANLVLGKGIHDYDSGFIVMRRSVLDSVTLLPYGYGAYFIELIYHCKRKGLSVHEFTWEVMFFAEPVESVAKSEKVSALSTHLSEFFKR